MTVQPVDTRVTIQKERPVHTMLVYFLGGISTRESAALKAFNKKNTEIQILCGGDSILNINEYIKGQILESFDTY